MMRAVERIIFKTDSKEEYLPGYSEKFPHVASYVELDKLPGRCVPWHWHGTLELFYLEKGILEYYTPGGKHVFQEGWGGLTNSNVLHMTRQQPDTNRNVHFVHNFDPVLISGEKGNLIDRKYVTPFVTNVQIELVALSPDDEEQKEVLRLIRESFFLEEEEKGYELRLREKLSEIWLAILKLTDKTVLEGTNEKSSYLRYNTQIKQMMRYVQEHYAEKISTVQLANAAFLSERGCYRAFQENLHMTPADYIRSYRLQTACQMLCKGEASLTEISQMCGLGSSSYFGKVFKEAIGCTPQQYRQKWQDIDRKRQN